MQIHNNIIIKINKLEGNERFHLVCFQHRELSWDWPLKFKTFEERNNFGEMIKKIYGENAYKKNVYMQNKYL